MKDNNNKKSSNEAPPPFFLQGGVIRRLSVQEVLNYEIHSNCFASWISFELWQDLLSKYFAWKVRRKYNRYLVSLEERNSILKSVGKN